MTKRTAVERAVQWLCGRLARRSVLSDFLDRVAGVSVVRPELAYAAGGPDRISDPSAEPAPSGNVMMAIGPGTGGDERRSADTPHTSHESNIPTPGILQWLQHLFAGTSHDAKKRRASAAQTHAETACSEPKYRGMHGRPCAHAGSSDTVCPTGTVSGWFWYYDTPAGRYYYVDCCGGTPRGSVWCNWSNENNWCVGAGRAANAGITEYNCTLAIPDAAMQTRELSPGKFEVVGVDP